MNFKLRDGKLYNSNGDIVPLEFGNIDQINFIKDLEKRLETLSTKGIDVDVCYEPIRFDAEIRFACLCGVTVYKTVEVYEEDNDQDLDGEFVKCRSCKTEYELQINDNGDLVAKQA
jgi:hypothetical protein